MIRTLLIELATVLAYAAWSANVAPVVVEDRCDVIEVNYYHDAEGSAIFTQVIFLNFNHADGLFDVVAWRLLKSNSAFPVKQGQGYVAVFHDGDTLRRVECKQVVVSWTFHDPELKQRERLPSEQRRELSGVRVTR